MRRELNGVKKAVASLNAQAVGQPGFMDAVDVAVIELAAEFTDRFDRIEQQLTILPRLEKFMNSYDFMASELLAMRSDRLREKKPS